MAGIDDLSEGLRKVFLAGVGAVATGAEKSQDVLNDLVAKGELTVEQGKELNRELTHKAKEAVSSTSDTALKSKLRSMTSEERAAWVAKAQKMADDLDAESTKVEVEAEDVTDVEPDAEADED